MFKNCVFKDSVNTRKWMVNAGIRALKQWRRQQWRLWEPVQFCQLLTGGWFCPLLLWQGLSVY